MNVPHWRQDVNNNNHHVVEEAVVHSKALSVETAVLTQVRQDEVKWGSGSLVRPVKPPQLTGQSADFLDQTGGKK